VLSEPPTTRPTEAQPRTRAAGLAARAERHPFVMLSLAVVLFSTGPVMVRASSVSGEVFSFWRLWFGVVVLGLLTLVHIRTTGRAPSPHAWRLAARAGVFFGLHQLFFMTALKATSVVDVTLVNTVAPVATAVLAVPMFGERPGVAFRVWSGVAIAGSALIVLAGSSGPEGDPGGMALAVVNVVWYSLFFLLSKRGRDHLDVVPFLFGTMAAAAVTVSLWVAVTATAVGTATRDDLMLAVTVAIVPGVLGHFLNTWPLRTVPANVPPLMLLAIPFLSGLMAWIFFGEGVGATHVVGGTVTVAGVAGAVLSPAGRRLLAGSAVPDPYPEA